MLGHTLKARYQLTRILGAGGFGQTYLAIDTQPDTQPGDCPQSVEDQTVEDQSVEDPFTEDSPAEGQTIKGQAPQNQSALRQCVVKQLKPASQDKTFLTVARRLFNTESKTLEKLGNHTQIPNSIDFFEEDNEFYLVQEFVDGESLEDEIKQAGKFSEAQAIALLEAVLPVLKFIHDNHVVHRDLKPDNLIRRRSTGEIVLIDFGAVKEIRTHLITGERTGLTIGIGTQGYTPSEQLSGKPRYSSDIYALGMTVIHALTGRSPTDLPESPVSLEPQWQDYAEVSPGLAIVLNNMTRHYIHHRYQNVEAVQHDLARLEDLPAEAAEAVTAIETLKPERMAGSEAKTVIRRWQMGYRARLLTVAISTLITSGFILGLRQLGAFVPAELAVYDRLVSTQADKGPDPRLLIVGVEPSDLRAVDSATPPDSTLAQVIDNLQAHHPSQIGVDLLRSPSSGQASSQPSDQSESQTEGEANAALQESLGKSNVLVLTQLSGSDRNNSFQRPPGVAADQLSFSRMVLDSGDFRVRRALLVDIDKEEQTLFSLGTESALRYLSQVHNIEAAESDILQLGDVRFEPITHSFGGYQNVDATGYQLFIRYRSLQNVAARVSFTDVLNNTVDPALIEDKIVLIGLTDSTGQDLFATPYNAGGSARRMQGVELHAQVASQILSAVLDGEPQPWVWPDAGEILWIVALTGIGSGLMVLTQRGPVLIAFGVSGLTVAALVSLVSFQLGGWVPMVAPMSAFFFAASGARVSKSYQRRHWEARQEADTAIEL